MNMHVSRLTNIVMALALCLATGTSAAAVTPLPGKELFRPLLADPKEPSFMLSNLNAESTVRDTTVAAIAYGENFCLLHWPGGSAGDGWQLVFAGAVFSQFDLEAPSMDLNNAVATSSSDHSVSLNIPCGAGCNAHRKMSDSGVDI